MDEEAWAEAENRVEMASRIETLVENTARIVQLLEGDKAFGGEVLRQILIENQEANLKLERLIRRLSPEDDAAWKQYHQSQPASTTAPTPEPYYPLIGDPAPPTPPQEIVLINGRATFGNVAELPPLNEYERVVSENKKLHSHLQNQRSVTYEAQQRFLEVCELNEELNRELASKMYVLFSLDPDSTITGTADNIISRLCDQYQELEKVVADPSYAGRNNVYLHHPTFRSQPEENKYK